MRVRYDTTVITNDLKPHIAVTKTSPPLFTAGILLDPVFRILFKSLSIILVFVCYTSLDCIIRIGFNERVAHQVEHGHDLIRWLPRIRAQHAEAHATFVIIGYIWVVYFGLEGEDWGLERIVGWEGDEETEVTALGDVSSCFTVK